MSWAVFLDRDGTIIHDRHHLSDPEGVELLPGAAEGLAALSQLGARLVVVSNQSGVGRGYFTLDDVSRVNLRLAELLGEYDVRLDAVYVCPHLPADGCNCRKPQPGLIVRAASELRLDLAESFMIGDREADVAAGAAAGATVIGIGGDTNASLVADDLRNAARIVAFEKKGPSR